MRLSIGVCLVVLLAALMSCGNDNSDNENSSKRSPSISPTPETQFSGLMFAADNFEANTTDLQFYDPKKQHVVARATVEGTSLYLKSDEFTSDLSGLVRVTDCKVTYAALENDHYAFTTTWEPPPAYEEQNPCFTQAFFGEGDTLWAVSTSGNTGPGRLYTIDRTKPRQEPKKIGDVSAINDGIGSPELDRYGKPGRETKLGIPGATEESNTIILSDKVFIRAIVWSSTKSGDQTSTFRYTCTERVDDATLLCINAPATHGYASPYGSVATVTVQRDAGVLEMQQVAPSSEGDTHGVWLSPDGKQVLIAAESGHYLMAFNGKTGKGEPELLFTDKPIPGDLVAWF